MNIRIVCIGLTLALLLAQVSAAPACPFCGGVQTTLSEEIDLSAVAVLAEMVTAPAQDEKDSTPGVLNVAPTKATFKILEVLKSADKAKSLTVGKKIEVIYFGDRPVGTQFLINGIDPPEVAWGTPIVMPQGGSKYLHDAMKLPKDGPERLAYFLDYLDHKDEMLSRDAYDEFGKAPYSDIKKLKGKLPHDKLVSWISDAKTSPSHKRLYLTMLGVCGTDKDIPALEAMVKSSEPKERTSLDATIACYLMLKGIDGLPLVESLFLKDNGSDDTDRYVDTNNAIMALRIMGQEEMLPRARLTGALRLVLNRPTLADLVIPDLARWEDWSAMNQLVELFKKADEKSAWVRVPVINYLRACPDPKAKDYLAELEKIDPKAFKQANNFFPLSTAISPTKADKKADDKSADGSKSDDKLPAAAAETKPAAEKPESKTKTSVTPAGSEKAKPGDAAKKSSAVKAPPDGEAVAALEKAERESAARGRAELAGRLKLTKSGIVSRSLGAILVFSLVFWLLVRNPAPQATKVA